MKRMLLIFLICAISDLQTVAQSLAGKYLEVPARFDAVGNIVMETLPETIKHGADTTIDNKHINQLISRGRRSQKVINLLAGEGWHLLIVLQPEKKGDRNLLAPDLLYYFKKE